MNSPSACSMSTLYTGKRTGVPQPTFHVMCDWSITSVPLSSRRTLVAAEAISAQRLSDGDQRRAALLLELLHPLGRVVEEAPAALHAQAPLVAQIGGGARDPALVGEVSIEEARDARVDVEAGHVEQLDRGDDGELVADTPFDAEVESLDVDHTLVDERETLAHDRV